MDENKEVIYWCPGCNVPVVNQDTHNFKNCPFCGGNITYLTSDIRPVFPEERLLFELLLDRPLAFSKKSVWCRGSTYFVDGEKYKISNRVLSQVDAEDIKKKLSYYNDKNTYQHFNEFINKFILANEMYFKYIRFEAMNFICDISEKYSKMIKYISFSGGKDSTVMADLVVKSLADPNIMHIFCNTTLEYPFTLDYIERLKKTNSAMIIKVAQNREHDFYSMCDDIGVPIRMKRWCCTIFKTGVISKLLKRLFGDKKLIYFNGLRKSESNTRSKYERVSISSEQKIQNQLSVSPIINWKDIDVWLYILSEKIDFNDAYRLGFARVGCFCCPNGSYRNEILAKIYLSEKANTWNDYLLTFANRINAENPIEYVNKGLWKAKQGGKGLKTYDEVSISNKPCTIDENAMSYKVGREITSEFYDLFIPFGDVRREFGKRMLNETLVIRKGIPIISIQVRQDETIKIKTMNVKDHKSLHRKINHQITKYKLCRRCYKCEAVCPRKAIEIENDKYTIDKEKCVNCMMCTQNQYIHEGCLMKRYLRLKEEKNKHE